MPSEIEFRFIKTKKKDPLLIELDDTPERKNLMLWASDVLSAIEPLPNPLTIEDIIYQTKKIIRDTQISNSMIYLAVGALLNLKYLEIVNF